MRRFVGIAILFCSTNLGAKEISLKTVERAKRSIVAVVCGYNDPATGKIHVATGLGSGFFVALDGTFVTAAHVIASKGNLPKETPRCDLGIYIAKTSWRPKGIELDAKWVRVDECTFDDTIDLAACRPASNPFEASDLAYPIKPMKLDETEPPDGFAVAFTGFPLNSIRPMTSIGHVSAYRGVNPVGPTELVIDKAGWPGVSGSPVYDGKGRAIGMVVQRGSGEGAGLAYARPSVFIRRFLSTIKMRGK